MSLFGLEDGAVERNGMTGVCQWRRVENWSCPTRWNSSQNLLWYGHTGSRTWATLCGLGVTREFLSPRLAASVSTA